MSATLSAESIIEKLMAAKKLEDVMDINHFKSEYESMLKLIHPDICKLKNATEATSKLNELRDKFKHGTKYIDDSGEFTSNGYEVNYSGDSEDSKRLYETSCKNFNTLISIKDKTIDHFRKYMPHEMAVTDGKLNVKFAYRAVPLSDLTLPQEHVNWILSRMLEYSAWLSQMGYVHCGINPESIFIIPETHGIMVTSFYHLTKKGDKAKTISGKYQSWYPPSLFSAKKATSDIDLELSKKTAIYLLGDKSGAGIKLRKTHNEKFLDFVIKHEADAYKAFTDYREFLSKNFEKKFHILNL